MKALKKVLEYSFYIIVILCFTFIISLFNGGGRKFSFNPSEFPAITEHEIPEDFQKKNKVIYFWATWCSVCETNLPFFKASYAMLNGKFNTQFISIEEGGGTVEQVKTFVEKHGMTFPTYFGSEELMKFNKIKAFPTTLFVNEKNEVKFIDTGIMNPISILIRVFFLTWN